MVPQLSTSVYPHMSTSTQASDTARLPPPPPLRGRPSGLTRLTELELQGCEGVSSDGLVHLAALHQLSALTLNQCHRVKGGLQHLRGE